MAISATYYLNGPTLGSSTTIYSNSNLTTIAPNGFYSDGVTSRQQVNGILLPAIICDTCATPCGSAISGSGETGVYLLNLDAGSTVSDVGAIIIRFDPFNVPDGIKATYNGTIYNALTSPVNGFHRSTNPSNYTVVGATGSDCGLVGNTTNLIEISEFLYNGTSFVSTGNTQDVTIVAGDVSLSSASPGSCMMVIPKASATPSIVNFEFIGPCSETGWEVDVQCPVLLTGFSSSVVASTSVAVCALSETVTYYNASLADTPGTVGLYDFVFSDAYGASPLAAGFYKAAGSITGSNDWFEVSSNGIVVALGVCSSVSCTLYRAQCDIGTGTADFTNCTTGEPDSVSLSVGETADFCAVTNTVTTSGGVTVSIIGTCS